MSYWDPLPAVRAAETGLLPAPDGGTWLPAPGYRGDWWNARPERWAERDWRNVPGPFYGAGTDNCWMGRLIAPAHVLYDDEWGAEFVYRQPRDTAQALALLGAVAQDPMAGYACDGDDHWTPELIRDWWRERGRVRGGPRPWIVRGPSQTGPRNARRPAGAGSTSRTSTEASRRTSATTSSGCPKAVRPTPANSANPLPRGA